MVEHLKMKIKTHEYYYCNLSDVLDSHIDM